MICKESLPVGLLCDQPAVEQIYTLSLHDALPILSGGNGKAGARADDATGRNGEGSACAGETHEAIAPAAIAIALENNRDRKRTRLNSSHMSSSYADLCGNKSSAPGNLHRREVHIQ